MFFIDFTQVAVRLTTQCPRSMTLHDKHLNLSRHDQYTIKIIKSIITLINQYYLIMHYTSHLI